MRQNWREVAGEADRKVMASGGYGHPVGLGSRLALLVVDTTYGFVGRTPAPIEESIREYPSSCGEAGWRAVAVIRRFLILVRRLGLPVFYSKGTGDASRLGLWADKRPASLRQPADSFDIVDEIAPQPNEMVIRKARPSAFFGTDLAQLVRGEEIDSLIVTGGTTSGCVRATVVDAFSHDLRVTVIDDAVFDRVELSHNVALYEMSQKYADVRTSADVLDELERGWSPRTQEPRRAE